MKVRQDPRRSVVAPRTVVIDRIRVWIVSMTISGNLQAWDINLLGLSLMKRVVFNATFLIEDYMISFRTR